MTSLTQSGFPVIPKYGDPRIELITVNGVDIAPGVLRGDVATILQWVAQQFNDTVDPLIPGECFGYAPRQIRGGTGWSNHASGTAIDLNGTKYPQGTYRMTAAQIAACHVIVIAARGVIRWGGSYRPPTLIDQQHFEMGDGTAGDPRVPQLADWIRTGSMPTAKELLDEPMDVRDPFRTEPDRTLAVRDVLAETYNSARVAARDTGIIRRKLGV